MQKEVLCSVHSWSSAGEIIETINVHTIHVNKMYNYWSHKYSTQTNIHNDYNHSVTSMHNH